MLRCIVLAGGLLVAAGPVRGQLTTLVGQAGHNGGVVAPAASPTVYFTAEQAPAFPGGNAALLKFLNNKLTYPAAALDRQLSGKVHVTFVVDTAGHLHDPRVVRGLGFGLDEEAIRLVRLMPWWTPGKIKGQPVWVQVTMPIQFRAL
jgi:protein TonB